MRIDRAIASLGLVVLLLAGTARAIDEKTPENPYAGKEAGEVIRLAVGALQLEVRRENVDTAEAIREQRERIYQIFLKTVDMQTVGRLTLARYFSRFSPEEFDKFIDVFYRVLFSTYITHLNKIGEQEIKINETLERGEDKVLVKTTITLSDGTSVPLEFSMIKKGVQWWIYDLKAEGVSIVSNYRSQFSDMLFRGTVESFLETLEKKRADLETKAVTEMTAENVK
jgi:phospholipid transport system substrate-binding protein